MPMCRIGCPVRIGIVVLLFFATASPAEQLVITPSVQGVPPRDRVPPPRTGTGVIRGRVVDGVTGAAIPRARVMLQGSRRSPMMTDGSGVFTFTELPMGPVMISVDKPTYLGTRYPAPGRTIRSNSRPLILAEGQTIDNVTIPIFHGASISGRVTDANGDLLDNAQVSVIRIPSPGRVGRPTQRGGTSTDDRGEFRIGRLEAGTYLVQVNARRQPGPDDMMPTPGAAPVPPSPQPLPTYYPGAFAIEQAQPITLEKGQAVTDIDIVLAEGIPGVVNGIVTTVTGAPPGESNGYVNTRRILADSSMNFDNVSSGTGIRPDGTFRLVLAPGEYQLEARVSPRVMNGPTRPEDEQFGSVKVTVASGAEDSVAIAVGRGAIATGRVVFEGTSAAPPSPGKARVPLFSESGQCRSGEATIAADWTFRLEGLSGTCSSPPMMMFGRWTIKAVIINGDNAAGEPVTFQPGQQFRNVQVIVTDKRSNLVFRVSDENGQATRDYVVVVYPVDKPRWVTGSRVFTGPSDLTLAMMRPAEAANTPGAPVAPPRREAMSGLPPGDYYVVAVDDLEPEDPRDPVVLERLRSISARVTLSEGADTEVPLRRVSFAEAMSRR
jgi:Carboxypeptidase regulatory-like domain